MTQTTIPCRVRLLLIVRRANFSARKTVGTAKTKWCPKSPV